jgi:uncharacterized protein (TIGR03435 family)
MKTFPLPCAALLAIATVAWSQERAFEVATVKPAQPELPLRTPMACGFSGDRFRGFGHARWLIACAYQIPAALAGQEISGGPKWLDEDLFEIQATMPPESARRPPAERLAMLKTFLADRFKLAIHRETKEVPQFRLVIAGADRRLGPRLRPTADECAAWIAGGRRGAPPPTSSDLPCGRDGISAFAYRTAAMTMARLATLLSPRVERPVQDQTGLTGYYAIDLQWKPEQAPAADLSDSLPTSIFTALQEQLGLKLESMKANLDLLVIDHIERPAPE